MVKCMMRGACATVMLCVCVCASVFVFFSTQSRFIFIMENDLINISPR